MTLCPEKRLIKTARHDAANMKEEGKFIGHMEKLEIQNLESRTRIGNGQMNDSSWEVRLTSILLLSSLHSS